MPMLFLIAAITFSTQFQCVQYHDSQSTSRPAHQDSYFSPEYFPKFSCPGVLTRYLVSVIVRNTYMEELRREGNDTLYTGIDAARYLDISYMTVWRWVKRGKLRPVFVLGHKYFNIEDLKAIKESRDNEH